MLLKPSTTICCNVCLTWGYFVRRLQMVFQKVVVDLPRQRDLLTCNWTIGPWLCKVVFSSWTTTDTFSFLFAWCPDWRSVHIFTALLSIRRHFLSGGIRPRCLCDFLPSPCWVPFKINFYDTPQVSIKLHCSSEGQLVQTVDLNKVVFLQKWKGGKEWIIALERDKANLCMVLWAEPRASDTLSTHVSYSIKLYSQTYLLPHNERNLDDKKRTAWRRGR